MESEYKVFTLPRRQEQILLVPVGLLLGVVGLLVILGTWMDTAGNPVLFLFLSLVGLALAGIGCVVLWGATLRIRLFPEGVAVMAGSKGVFMLPAEKIRLICQLSVFNGKRYTRMIGLSSFSMEELAEKRERELLKNPLSRHNVIIRKRKTDWVESFAKEYLSRGAKNYPVQPMNAGILWFVWSEDLRDLLKQTYPGAEYIVWKRSGNTKKKRWKDRDNTDFLRGWEYRSTGPWIIRIGTVFVAAILWLCVLVPAVWGFAVILLLLFCGIFLISGGEGDRIWVSEAGLRVYRNEKIRQFLPVERIKTVFRIPINGPESTTIIYSPEDSMLLVTDKTMAELAAESIARMKNRREGRYQIALWEGLTQPDRRAVSNLMARKAQRGFSLFSKDMIFGYAQGREETLRRCFPEALWIDLRWEEME